MATNRPSQITRQQLEIVLQHSQSFPVKRVELSTGLAREAYISKTVLLEYASRAKSIMAFGGFPKIKAVERVQIIPNDGKYMFSVEFGRLVFLP